MIGSYRIVLTVEQDMKLQEYRRRRKAQRGKSLQCSTALVELIEAALSGIQPKEVATLEALERRVEALEAKAD